MSATQNTFKTVLTAMSAMAVSISFAQTPVEVILTEGVVISKELQGPIKPTKVTSTFSSAGTNNNVHAIFKFKPFGKSVGLRAVVTQDTPDGRFEQDRVLSVKSTEFNVTTSYAIREAGKYCLTAVDEFDEQTKYSGSACFTVK